MNYINNFLKYKKVSIKNFEQNNKKERSHFGKFFLQIQVFLIYLVGLQTEKLRKNIITSKIIGNKNRQ